MITKHLPGRHDQKKHKNIRAKPKQSLGERYLALPRNLQDFVMSKADVKHAKTLSGNMLDIYLQIVAGQGSKIEGKLKAAEQAAVLQNRLGVLFSKSECTMLQKHFDGMKTKPFKLMNDLLDEGMASDWLKDKDLLTGLLNSASFIDLAQMIDDHNTDYVENVIPHINKTVHRLPKSVESILNPIDLAVMYSGLPWLGGVPGNEGISNAPTKFDKYSPATHFRMLRLRDQKFMKAVRQHQRDLVNAFSIYNQIRHVIGSLINRFHTRLEVIDTGQYLGRGLKTDSIELGNYSTGPQMTVRSDCRRVEFYVTEYSIYPEEAIEFYKLLPMLTRKPGTIPMYVRVANDPSKSIMDNVKSGHLIAAGQLEDLSPRYGRFLEQAYQKLTVDMHVPKQRLPKPLVDLTDGLVSTAVAIKRRDLLDTHIQNILSQHGILKMFADDGFVPFSAIANIQDDYYLPGTKLGVALPRQDYTVPIPESTKKD